MSPHDEVALRLQVANRQTGAEGVVVLDLRDPSGAELPTWAPGAHIDLELPEDLVRQYSLCGDPADHSAWRVAVLREPNSRGGSEHIHEALVEGATVDVRGPRNHFPLLPSANYIFIAGGIGITPILPMLGAADTAWSEGSLHVERFSPKEHGAPARGDAFEVELATSGMTLTVPPDKSILDAAEEAGVPVVSSCREGTCGTCETPVLKGEVDHRDSLLTPAEQAANDTMFICVSRAACPRLVLEL
jgi:ferredoxin-NADP reductase